MRAIVWWSKGTLSVDGAVQGAIGVALGAGGLGLDA